MNHDIKVYIVVTYTLNPNYWDPIQQSTNVQDIGIELGLGIRYKNKIGPIGSRLKKVGNWNGYQLN